MKIKLLIFSIIVITGISCSPKKNISETEIPSSVISPDSMVIILADIQFTEAILREYKRLGKEDVVRNATIYQEVFDKYDLKPEKYKSSITFYEQHPEIYRQIYTDAITKLTQMQTEFNKAAE